MSEMDEVAAEIRRAIWCPRARGGIATAEEVIGSVRPMIEALERERDDLRDQKEGDASADDLLKLLDEKQALLNDLGERNLRLVRLLNDVAFELKGPPDPSTLHEWDDLPSLIREAKVKP